MDTSNSTNEYLDLIEKYKLLVENTVECIWLFDLANRRFKYISPSIITLRGLTVNEAMNEKLSDCLTPDSLKKIQSECTDRLLQFLSGNRSESINEYDHYCKDGTIKAIEISTKFIINNETHNIDILGISRNITQQQKLSTKKDFVLKNLFNNGRIYFFGKLLVYGNSNASPVKWRTSKSEELFAYLLQNRELDIPKWKICDALWPEDSIEKINNHLHTSLYKMKQTLTLANINFDIKFVNGCYWFNIPNTYIDTSEFDSIIYSNILITADSIENYKKLFSLYKNEYLDGNDFVWSLLKRESYSIKYSKLAKSLINYYMKTNNYIDAEIIIQNFLEKYPLDEFGNEMYLTLYFIKKDRVAFINHYNAIKKLFKTELEIEPNDNIQALYTTILYS
jgi:PAS domain S-box-containing protein